jgi:hypothetical protein
MLRIVGKGTAEGVLLWHSTTKAGTASRGVNAGTIVGRDGRLRDQRRRRDAADCQHHL